MNAAALLFARLIDRMAVAVAAIAGAALLFTSVWISYGVFARYVLKAPSRFVVEACALLLLPLVFAGLAYAMRTNAFPRVTMLLDRAGPRLRRFLDRLNLVLTVLVGAFYLAAGATATLTAYRMDSASAILLWPESIFWGLAAATFAVFVLVAGSRLAAAAFGDAHGDRHESLSD